MTLKEMDDDAMSRLIKAGLTILEIEAIKKIGEEYKKPNHGKWEGNT